MAMLPCTKASKTEQLTFTPASDITIDSASGVYRYGNVISVNLKITGFTYATHGWVAIGALPSDVKCPVELATSCITNVGNQAANYSFYQGLASISKNGNSIAVNFKDTFSESKSLYISMTFEVE